MVARLGGGFPFAFYKNQRFKFDHQARPATGVYLKGVMCLVRAQALCMELGPFSHAP